MPENSQLNRTYALLKDDGTPRTDEMAAEDREHSQWFDRNVMWMHREI